MPSEAESNAANVGPVVEINGACTAIILVTTDQGAVEGLAMIRENLILIKDILQLALDGWGIIRRIWLVIISFVLTFMLPDQVLVVLPIEKNSYTDKQEACL